MVRERESQLRAAPRQPFRPHRRTSNVYASLAHSWSSRLHAEYKAIETSRAPGLTAIRPRPKKLHTCLHALLPSKAPHASPRQLRRGHASPPPLPRCTDGHRPRRDGHVRLRRMLAVQVRARHRLRDQPQVPPHLHRLHRVVRRHLQQLHRRGRQRSRGIPTRGRVRPVPVPRRPEPGRLRGVRAGDRGSARLPVRQLLRRVAPGGRVLRAVRRQRLRRPRRQHRRVPQVQLRHQRGRRVPQEPRRRAPAAAGAAGGDGVQADRVGHGGGGGAVPRRHQGARLRRLSGGGGRAGQGRVRLGARRRRLLGAVLRQVLGEWPRFPLFPRLFGGRIWKDRGNNCGYLGWAGTPRRLHLFPHQSMLDTEASA